MQPSACCCLCCWRPAAPPGPTTPPRRWGWRPCWRARCGRCCAGSARPSTACRRGGSGRCTAAWLRRTLCSCLCWGRGLPMCSSAISALSTKACPSCWPTAALLPTTTITSPAPTTSAGAAAGRVLRGGVAFWHCAGGRGGRLRGHRLQLRGRCGGAGAAWLCAVAACAAAERGRCSFWPAARRWPPLWLWTPYFYSDTLCLPFLALAFAAWARWRCRGGAGWAALCGAAIFAGGAVKGSVLVLLVAAGAGLCLCRGRGAPARALPGGCGAAALLRAAAGRLHAVSAAVHRLDQPGKRRLPHRAVAVLRQPR